MKNKPNDPELLFEESGDEDDTCVLDPNKVCDNCFRCLESEADYATVEIDGIYMNGERIY
ncbi:MAG: hypothetical protein IJP98_02005 [Clostridia bacterium]|nr:hypothetical protein [Clostridia bacterium]